MAWIQKNTQKSTKNAKKSQKLSEKTYQRKHQDEHEDLVQLHGEVEGGHSLLDDVVDNEHWRFSRILEELHGYVHES